MKHVRFISGMALSTAAIGAAIFFHSKIGPGAPEPTQPVAASPVYVGAAACVKYHATEVNAWNGSHHELAMQHATEQSMLGDCNDAQYQYNMTIKFSKHERQTGAATQWMRYPGA
jgi:hypothetical protein